MRVLSGIQPTGRFHWGNYFGAIRNWVGLQDQYRCLYFIADWHALTSDYADPSKIHQATFDAAADWLAAAGCTHVAMESTGVYWIAPHEVLEAEGF